MKKNVKKTEASPDVFKKQVLTSKMLFNDLIYSNRVKDRTKPVLNPSAPSSTLCEPVYDLISKIEGLQNALNDAKIKSRELYNLILCLSNNGLRISEVLNLSPDKISPAGRFMIKGLKGSNDRIINDPSISDYLLICKKNNSYPFKTFNRFFVYRYLKSFGVKFDSIHSSKHSITSSFRHKAIQDVNIITNKIETKSAYIGHKNTKTTEHYGKQRKQ
jgi:integrase